jgi:hypothetical protein
MSMPGTAMIPNMSRENSHRLSAYDIPSPAFAAFLPTGILRVST